MKRFFYDLETTGTKHWRNGIHQISGFIEIDGEVKADFNFHVQPNPKCEIEKDALDVAGVTLEEVSAYPVMEVVYGQLMNLLSNYVDKYDKKDKFFTIGYNSGFDNAFLRAFFVQNGDQYFGSWFAFPDIDVAILAAQFIGEKRLLMPDFKLKTVASTLGIVVDETKLHDAMYDIYLTREIYNFVTNKNNIK